VEADVPASVVLPSEGDVVAREVVLGEHARALLDLPSARIGGLVDDGSALRLTLRLEDDPAARRAGTFELAWRQWLRAWNVLQTVPDAVLTTRAAILAGDGRATLADAAMLATGPAVSVPTNVTKDEVATRPDDGAREGVLRDIRTDDLRQLIRTLYATHPERGSPVIPFELRRPAWRLDEDVELAWPSERVAFYFDDQRDAAHLLRDAGWTVLQAERAIQIEELERALGWARDDRARRR
jgi:hypothetical protein